MDMVKKKEELLRIFAPKIRNILEKTNINYKQLQEIRLRAHSPLFIVYKGEERAITREGGLTENGGMPYLVTEQDLKDTLQIVSSYSLYAYEEEVKQGFLTISGGHRVGIVGKAIVEGGKVKSLKYISGMNVRVSHQMLGCADRIMPYVVINKEPCNCLIISPPRCGKTTLLRDMVRQFSNGMQEVSGKNVGVVDERSEIAGCYMGIPQNDVGTRTDILDCCPKSEGMMMLIRSMAPEIVAVDEIGDEKDANAIEAVIHCGCKLFATVHGSSMEDIKRKPLLKKLMEENIFDRYLLLKKTVDTGSRCTVFNSDGEVLFKS